MRNVLIAVSVLTAACNAIVSFDRSRIGEGGMDASLDAGIDASIDGGACDPGTHLGCGQDELCCDQGGSPTCVAIGAAQCSACGTACDGDATSACVARECRCGDGAACSGATPLCDDASGTCVECRDASDCGGEQCVAGSCVECDPTDNSGCSGTTPICNAATSTCRACAMAPDDCPDPLECTASGVCGGCNDSSDCTTPTTPICDSGTTACRGCTGTAECMDEVDLDFCASDGSCAPCDPEDDAGCSGATPVCAAGAGGALACAACASDGDCAARTGTPICATAGANMGACVACDADDESVCAGMDAVCDVTANTCIECNDDADCDGTTPVCDGGSCRGCTATSECTTGVCVTSGPRDGACGGCDPAAPGVCPGPTPVCASGTATCVVCTTDPQCAAITLGSTCLGDGTCSVVVGCSPACSGRTPVCNGSTCEACDADADCPGQQCALSGPMSGACGACDPVDSAGCAAGRVCNPSTLICVDCVGAGDCGEAGFDCNINQCQCADRPPGNDCGCGAANCSVGQRCDRSTNTCV